jgi:hypothetical protein
MTFYLDWHILSHKKGSRSGSDINHIHSSDGVAAAVAGKIGCTTFDRVSRAPAPLGPYYMYYWSTCCEKVGVISGSNAFRRLILVTKARNKATVTSTPRSAAEHSSLGQLLTIARDWQATVDQCGNINEIWIVRQRCLRQGQRRLKKATKE